jgi:hypothetical protein
MRGIKGKNMSEPTQYTHTLFQCTKDKCTFICYTVNKLQEHMLDKHSSLVVPTYTVNGFAHGEERENESSRQV